MAPLLLAAIFYQAQPRVKPVDYPAHAVTPKLGLGAEYMAHSLLAGGQSIFISDYLVIEVEVFPAVQSSVMVSQNHFTLRVNGKKPALLSQSPGMAAASVKYPDWERRPTLEAGVGLGDGAVIAGRPRHEPRFPGDQARRPLPPPPQAPTPEDRSGLDREQKEPAHEIVAKAGLPEGETAKPVKGILLFPHRGKPASIKKLELLYHGPGGEAAIVLLER
jgi:hypothetical protein